MNERHSGDDDRRAAQAQPAAEQPSGEELIQRRFEHIGRTIAVLSGKGGVGKSTVAVNLAVALARRGLRVGILDADLHGPSVPQLLGCESAHIVPGAEGMLPVSAGQGIAVMSIKYFLRSDDDAVIWRGPLKYSSIMRLLGETEWGELDYLIIDLPPGTGDEPLSVLQLVPDVYGALVITTPQDVALADVRRSINFCRQLSVPVLGIVENMSYLVCPHCGSSVTAFPGPGGERLAREMNVPLVARIPLDPRIGEGGDSGNPFVLSGTDLPAAQAFSDVVVAVVGGTADEDCYADSESDESEPSQGGA
ncbi:MAG: Mrp/NBP35 family ATP-binding protein [Thermoleophilia bacterium]